MKKKKKLRNYKYRKLQAKTISFRTLLICNYLMRYFTIGKFVTLDAVIFLHSPILFVKSILIQFKTLNSNRIAKNLMKKYKFHFLQGTMTL